MHLRYSYVLFRENVLSFGGTLGLNLSAWRSLSKKILFLAFQNVPQFLIFISLKSFFLNWDLLFFFYFSFR